MQTRLALLPMLLAASFAAAQEQEAAKPRKSVAEMFLAQAAALSPELGKATAKAQMHNKNVLVLFPESDQDLAAMLKKDRAMSRPLLYEVEMASVSGEAAAKAAKCWGVADDRPAAVMLDKRGTVLERLGAADLVVDDKVPGADLLKKLEPKWATPVDAEQKLTVAMAEAKNTGRNVFIRFDAPW